MGSANLDYTNYQVSAMAMDYTTGTMYGLTLPSDYSFATWASEKHPGELVTIDLDSGTLTTVATLSFETPVFALACGADGQLYAAGGSFDYYADSATIYTMDKLSGELAEYTVVEGAAVYTGANYYGGVQYNSQMTYDYGTDRLYLYATVDSQNYYDSFGMYMVQLGDEPEVTYLDGISLQTRAGSAVKYGEVYLGLLSFIPEADEVPVNEVNGIYIDRTSGRVAAGSTTQIRASVRPSNAADPTLTWRSSNPNVARVDENGLVTARKAGTVTITVTSNETGVSAKCDLTVIELEGAQSVAYTVSGKRDALISFNPQLPNQTTEVVTALSGGSNIRGIAYDGVGSLYYLVYNNYSNDLYRFDLTTQQSVYVGSLSAFTEVVDIAYDITNGMLYGVGGFYLFQYDLSTYDGSGYINYTNYMMDSDHCTMSGVECIDGAVYAIGNDYYTSVPKMMHYSDKYLSDRTVILEGFGVNLVPGATDFGYDASAELFYLTDAGHNIYSMDLDGNVEIVDMLADGLDLNGLGIIPATAE